MSAADHHAAAFPAETQVPPYTGWGEDHGARQWRLFAKALMDASGNAIFVVDPTGKVLISNSPVQSALALFPGNLLPRTLPEFWPPCRQVLETGIHLRDLSLNAAGTSYRARLSPVNLKDTLIGVLCVLEDRTELEETTREMHSYQELSRELDAIIDSSDEGLWICDHQGVTRRINAASERINRIRASEVVGRKVETLVAEGFIDSSVTLKVLQTRKRESMLQQMRSGRKLMVTGNPVFNSHGDLIRVVVNERDITEIDELRAELEAQEAKTDQIRRRMQELQIAEMASGQIIARSANMVRALRQAHKVSQFDSTVLIIGESGAGKGVVASLIQRHSMRSERAFVHVNCGAIPETLVESELFGYEKGAFTGAAKKGKPGYFEMADGGVLFLDEVAELPLASQVKLLRFLEDGKVTRVGGTVPKALDVRVICATHRDLEQMVTDGEFRLDLFYRLNVVPIHVPPLREREACLLPLIQHFFGYFKSLRKTAEPLRLSRQAMEALLSYHYPGNVRELMNICERIVVMAESSLIDFDDLPRTIVNSLQPAKACMVETGQTLPQTMALIERQLIAQALEIHGTQAKAAKALGINQSTIARKLKRPSTTTPSHEALP